MRALLTGRPKRGQVLVRMLAASPSGRADVAGVVEDIGPGATRFARGDRVFGHLVIFARGQPGSPGEALVVSEAAPLAHIPAGLDPLVAATLPTAASTALDIVDLLEPLHGRKVLVIGDGDGIGSFATQFAANAGAHVIAQTSAAEAARMRAYGAAETVDGPVTAVMDSVAAEHPGGIDVVIDLASDPGTFADLGLLLRPWGTALTTRHAADPYRLATTGIIGINHTVKISAPLLRRVGEAIADRLIFPPPMPPLQLQRAA